MPHALIVNDAGASRSTLVDQVQQRGLSSDVASTIEQAKQHSKQQQPDLIITDTKLTDGCALDLLTNLRPKSPPHVAILCDDPEIQSAFQKMGSPRITSLPKTADHQQLRQILDAVIRQVGYQRYKKPTTKKQYASMDWILGSSQPMQRIHEMIAKVAPTDATVLVSGETGTGKELVARAIHQQSTLNQKPFEAINCGAIPENLVESELFGHEKGAFTGANKTRRGVFERASGGTLFLDEITEMRPDMQVRLLRVLEEGVLMRVGSEKEIKVDVRLIAATNRDTNIAVEQGDFREDLLFRIAVFPIALPPLRERGDDVVTLAQHFLEKLNAKEETNKTFTTQAIQLLKTYHWPGNVRQLRNVITRSFIVENQQINLDCIHDFTPNNTNNNNSDGNHNNDSIDIPVGTSIDDAEAKLIHSTIEQCNGDKKQAAQLLGISLRTLYNRLKTLT